MSLNRTNPTKWGAPSEDSDQPGHPPSLIKVFAVRMKKAWVLSYPLSAQRRLWSDCTDAPADPSLRWAHSHFVGFDMSWLIYFTTTVDGRVHSDECMEKPQVWLLKCAMLKQAWHNWSCKIPKYSDTRKIAVIILKFEQCGYHRVMRYSRNGKQCRPWSDCSLI